ncbi:TPA: resolvase [Enterococcus faecium]|nr:resolvase [Enterococcus faecium]RIX92340.1 resolvase [Enterococcus faecium TX1330]HAQ4438762.1 resolvase [Enterococcus faecium]HAY0795017.1 resolvase [Enterococcus faecium]HAY1348588.1 resolvase [Enterococcus faecium]
MKKDIFVIESLERLGRSYDEIFYIVQQLD